MAAYCAKAGMEAVVVMPEHTPEVFKEECRLYGATLILLAASGNALACSCAPPPSRTLDEIKAEGIKVLLGRVLSKVKTGGEDINKGQVIYQIEIDDSINLPPAGLISVNTAPNGALCGVDLIVGRKHVLHIQELASGYYMSLCSNLKPGFSDAESQGLWDQIISAGN